MEGREVSDITLAEYAARNGRTADTATQRARRGAFITAHKVGRQWMIDENEKWTDGRSMEKETIYWYGVEALPPLANNMVDGEGNPMGDLHAFTSLEKAKAWNKADLYEGGLYNRYLLDRDKARRLMVTRLERVVDMTRAELETLDDEHLYAMHSTEMRGLASAVNE